MDEPLFPGYDPPEVAPGPALSAGQRITLRQQAGIAVGIHPLTKGPLHPLASRHRDASAPKDDPFTCGSCYFRAVLPYHNGGYPKCLFGDGRRVAHSQQSDVRAWWPACPDYSPSDRVSPDAARSIPT